MVSDRAGLAPFSSNEGITIMKLTAAIGILMGCGLATASHAAPPQQVSARDPQAIVDLLDTTGFEPKLEKDSGGDPMISLKVGGYISTMYFYGCDEKHADCDSVQLQASFNRKDPWPAKAALDVAKKWRYIAVWLDDEGDPVLTHDIVTGDGIPAKVFLKGLNAFGDSLDEVANMVFPDDGSQDTTK